jgi:hypothetical protein
MVKDSKKKAAKAAAAPITVPGPGIRSERLTMRVHPHLMHILDMRAAERNLSRSAYIESILIAWTAADPRNPKIDSGGKLVDGAPTPIEQMNKNSLAFGAKWAKFNQAYAILFGQSAPSQWVEEPEDHWFGDDDI